MSRYLVSQAEADADFSVIAAELGIQPAHARCIYTSALKKCRAILAKHGITNLEQVLPEIVARHDCRID